MIESIRTHWIASVLFTIAFLGLLWVPDFGGYNHAYLSFRLPCTGAQFEGSLFDSTRFRLLTMLIAMANGLALMMLSMRYLSLGKANTLIPFFYLLTIFSFPQARAFSLSFPATLLVILGLHALLKSGEDKRPIVPLFMSSFFVGCACLLYVPGWIAVVSFVVIAIALHIFSGRNILVFLGGLLCTLYGTLLSIYFLIHDISNFWSTMFSGVDQWRFQLVPRTPATLFLALTIFYLLGRTVLRWLYHSFGNKSYRFRVLSSLMWMLVICGVPMFVYVNQIFDYLAVLAIPVSVLLAYNFSEEHVTKRMKVEFAVLLLAVAINQIAYFI